MAGGPGDVVFLHRLGDARQQHPTENWSTPSPFVREMLDRTRLTCGFNISSWRTLSIFYVHRSTSPWMYVALCLVVRPAHIFKLRPAPGAVPQLLGAFCGRRRDVLATAGGKPALPTGCVALFIIRAIHAAAQTRKFA